MTDKEIVKGLATCISNSGCVYEQCPIYGTEYCINPIRVYERLVDIINRQNAEIERLTARDCPDCAHFVGCEAASRGRPCDLFTKKGE